MPKSTPSRARGRPSLSPGDVADGRRRIAAVAERLFRDEGFKAVAMRRIAGEVGCAPMTLYAYFADKADILRQIWNRFFMELFDDLARRARKIADPARRLVTISRLYVRYWVDHPERYRMVFMTEGVTQGDVGDFVSASDILSRYDLFAETLKEASGATKGLKLWSEALICGLNGIAHNHVTISKHDWEGAERLAEAVAAAILAQAVAGRRRY